MNRIFGSGKPKAPPPNLTDCIGTVRFGFLYFVITIIMNSNITHT